MRVSAILCLTISVACITGCQTIGDITNSGGHPDATATPAAAAIVAPVAAPPVANTNGSFVGMGTDKLRALWGDPVLTRKDIGVELWTYGGKNKCSVLVYFYPSADGALMAARAEAVPGGADEATVAACAKANDLPSLKPIS